MSTICDCAQCKRDNILNGTLTADCSICSTKLDMNVKFQVMTDKTLVCDKCVAEHFVVCGCCAKLHKKGTLKLVPSESNEPVPVGATPQPAKKIEVCEVCFKNNYRDRK